MYFLTCHCKWGKLPEIKSDNDEKFFVFILKDTALLLCLKVLILKIVSLWGRKKYEPHIVWNIRLVITTCIYNVEKAKLIATISTWYFTVYKGKPWINRSACLPVFTFAHKFSYDVDRLLRHHGIEGHQFVMSEFLHDLSLLQEGLWGHCARLQGLNSHFSCAIPRACIKT